MKHAVFFFGLPTVAIIAWHFLFWEINDFVEFSTTTTPILFLSLIIFAYGYFGRGKKKHFFLFIAWLIFASYWAMQPEYLYYKEEGDVFNATFCILGVYFLSYISYHEYLSYKRNERVKSLDFLAGSTFYASLIYFVVQKIPFLAGFLIKMVAVQSVWLLKIFGYNISVGNPSGMINIQVPIYFNDHYSVSLVLACTGLQSMAVFIGVLMALKGVDLKRRIKAFLATIPTIYVLNLIRNAGVIYGVEKLGYSFSFMHNVVGKTGSLLALIIIAYYIFDLLPELYDRITGIVDLYKRYGPIERMFLR